MPWKNLMNYTQLEISHVATPSYRRIILKDITNNCCLDEWKIDYNENEKEQRIEFENDLRILGFNP